jgi:hypothetical protein
LLAHPHLLRGGTYEFNDSGNDRIDCAKQKRSEACQPIVTAREESEIVSRIEIESGGEQKNICRRTARPEFGAIRVPFPAHIAKQPAIRRMKSDEITAAAMIWTENQLPGPQLGECPFDVARPQAGAIAADRDDLVVSKPGDSFDRVLKPGSKTNSHLAMNRSVRRSRCFSRREKMDIRRAGNLRAESSDLEERPRCLWESAPGQIDLDFVRKDKKRAPGHASGYETCPSPDKPFSTRLFAKLDDFEPDQILPGFRPTIEERPIVRFHQLETAIAIFL